MKEGNDGEKNNYNSTSGRGGGIERVHNNDDEEDEEEKDQSAPKLLQRYEHKVYELASEFEEEMVRF